MRFQMVFNKVLGRWPSFFEYVADNRILHKNYVFKSDLTFYLGSTLFYVKPTAFKVI